MSAERSAVRVFVYTVSLVFLLTIGLHLCLMGPNIKKELFLCWLAALFNAYSFAFISRKGIGQEMDAFFGRFALGHVLRVLAVLVPVFLAYVDESFDFKAVATMVMAGYFLILLIELKELARRAD